MFGEEGAEVSWKAKLSIHSFTFVEELGSVAGDSDVWVLPLGAWMIKTIAITVHKSA